MSNEKKESLGMKIAKSSVGVFCLRTAAKITGFFLAIAELIRESRQNKK
ncbi:MAG: hypothetical protein J6L88_03830 [Clostridia bacterium]|nr:hypothetical protein [Clostridia bacterium]